MFKWKGNPQFSEHKTETRIRESNKATHCDHEGERRIK